MVFPYRLLMVLTDPIDSSTGLSPSDLEGEGILSKEAYDAMTYTVQVRTGPPQAAYQP